MYIHISYDEGIQEDSNIEAVIRKVCDEVSRVYGLEEDEMSILLCDNAKIHEASMSCVSLSSTSCVAFRSFLINKLINSLV